jgi:hypothetical protein
LEIQVFAPRRRPDARRVRPAAGLGHGDGGERRLRAPERTEEPLLLFRRAEVLDRRGEEAVGRDQVADADVAVTQLLLDQHLGQQVGATAAELLGQHERGQSERGRLLPHVERRLGVRLVDGTPTWTDLLGRELPGQFYELLLFDREPQAVADGPPHLAPLS